VEILKYLWITESENNNFDISSTMFLALDAMSAIIENTLLLDNKKH
jgi:hypothetical protein